MAAEPAPAVNLQGNGLVELVAMHAGLRYHDAPHPPFTSRDDLALDVRDDAPTGAAPGAGVWRGRGWYEADPRRRVDCARERSRRVGRSPAGGGDPAAARRGGGGRAYRRPTPSELRLRAAEAGAAGRRRRRRRAGAPARRVIRQPWSLREIIRLSTTSQPLPAPAPTRRIVSHTARTLRVTRLTRGPIAGRESDPPGIRRRGSGPPVPRLPV